MKTITILSVIVLNSGMALGAMVSGCAGVGQLTPGGAVAVSGAVTVAQGLLHSLDNFYGDLVELKTIPDHRVEATRALTLADAAATGLRAVIAGASVDDKQLNLMAGQVSGAQSILKVAEKK